MGADEGIAPRSSIRPWRCLSRRRTDPAEQQKQIGRLLKAIARCSFRLV